MSLRMKFMGAVGLDSARVKSPAVAEGGNGAWVCWFDFGRGAEEGWLFVVGGDGCCAASAVG